MAYFIKRLLRLLCGLDYGGPRVEAGRLVRRLLTVIQSQSHIIALKGTRRDWVLDIS